MANLPLKPCTGSAERPRCEVLTNQGKCPDCRTGPRGGAHARGYTREWGAYARAYLQTHQVCGEQSDGRITSEHGSTCVRLGRRTRAEVVDHIKPIAHDGQRFDPSNHQAMCRRCNTRKANAFEGGFGRRPEEGRPSRNGPHDGTDAEVFIP